MSNSRQEQVRQVLDIIEQQISEAEAQLLRPMSHDESRSIIERVARLKIALQMMKPVIEDIGPEENNS